MADGAARKERLIQGHKSVVLSNPVQIALAARRDEIGIDCESRRQSQYASE